MNENDWNGGREDSRLYSKVRSEKQKFLVAHYERIRPFLDENGSVLSFQHNEGLEWDTKPRGANLVVSSESPWPRGFAPLGPGVKPCAFWMPHSL